MENNFNLSEKIEVCKCEEHNLYGEFINIEDIREFIRLLKDDIKKGDLYRCKSCKSTLDFLNKLSGEKINGN